MEKTGRRVTNWVTFLLRVVFFVGFVTCPSNDEFEKARLFDKLSKVIVRSYATGAVHVYNDAALYRIKRPAFVKQISSNILSSNVTWFALRVRKSPSANFRTLADICDMHVEFLLLTEKTVKMIFNEDYEYTLNFVEDDKAESFVNIMREFSKKRGKEVEYETLRLGSIVRNDGSRDVISATLGLVERKISDQVVLFYGRSIGGNIYFMFPNGHFHIDVKAPKELLITPMVVRGRPLDYKYRLEFHEKEHREMFLRSATNHQFVTGNAPDSEPRDTGHSDRSITSDGSDFYDEEELKCFRKEEAKWK